MNWGGIFLGAASFVIIGLFHPIVIRAEYHFGKGCWPAFLIAGVLLSGGSLTAKNLYASGLLGILGFSCFWSIRELFEQERRVEKGWFPKNEKRKNNEFTQ